ncbi:hypothetical protein OGAPHI_001042 [Ogataea philodendri]|uniref:Uncharacterized protein n=1 Tax=Ogataea philodendri TaxID=1378263 RepID=A0A9P8PFW8_9ASCO|nr:uncharacterized protein OGAPHI_001042 [Ogataea philodendri]KAH3670527.1 hypothetical protein OGAPHI_001042 [Ogataea philodendri]
MVDKPVSNKRNGQSALRVVINGDQFDALDLDVLFESDGQISVGVEELRTRGVVQVSELELVVRWGEHDHVTTMAADHEPFFRLVQLEQSRVHAVADTEVLVAVIPVRKAVSEELCVLNLGVDFVPQVEVPHARRQWEPFLGVLWDLELEPHHVRAVGPQNAVEGQARVRVLAQTACFEIHHVQEVVDDHLEVGLDGPEVPFEADKDVFKRDRIRGDVVHPNGSLDDVAAGVRRVMDVGVVVQLDVNENSILGHVLVLVNGVPDGILGIRSQ